LWRMILWWRGGCMVVENFISSSLLDVRVPLTILYDTVS
jgi:hypothetical protein